MKVLTLTASEIRVIESLIFYLKKEYENSVDINFLQKVNYYASELPRRIREFYKDLKYNELDRGMTIVRGLVVDKLGPTPSSWNYPESYTPSHNIDYFSVLLSSFLGNVFGWASQQKGKIIHDLIPIKNKESAQTGYGSHSELHMHTEDSFHKNRGEYICFYCMRNPDEVNTTMASIRDFNISDEIKEILFERRFVIRPDESHLDKHQLNSFTSDQYLLDIKNSHDKLSLLYGNFEYPYICYDPFYTLCVESDKAAHDALTYLSSEVQKNTLDVPLIPGDICILDNRKAVHGRRPFSPRYDGTDRWLKRLNIASTLRSSADIRSVLDSRVIGESKLTTSLVEGN